MTKYFFGYYPHGTYSSTPSKILFYNAATGNIERHFDLKKFLRYILSLGLNVESVECFGEPRGQYGPSPEDRRISLTRKHVDSRDISITRFEDGVYFAYGINYMVCAESSQELMIRLAIDGKYKGNYILDLQTTRCSISSLSKITTDCIFGS